MNSDKMMGFEMPGDQKVPVPVRDWNGMKLGLWRSKVAWDFAARAATEIIAECAHMAGCPGILSETSPCSPDCIDREKRMSALVILNAARMFAPINARKLASEPYFAPSREYFSEVISELAAAQIELEALRGALRAAGMQPPSPPVLTQESPRLTSATQEKTQ